MKPILLIAQVLTAILLIGSILIQNSKGGLGNAFGGGQEFRTKRGAEKIIFRSTIVLICIFLVISITNLLLR